CARSPILYSNYDYW
nr:immunoglobulin heavy chain junction region [Mus musculus]MBK4183948.1 immunoglobulin heavy chain junction region [Mus musculus]MBK4183949.1 immunoglobulin heavy chain junction region [Mus musculus]MBK4183950.1 immunoglobulin heavy chain junction region [Mus musculus]MBK4183951.1 immunoglobulin heavy chain junction region [Mus musculus]